MHPTALLSARSPLAIALLLSALGWAGCGPSPRPRGPTEADLRSFTEAEAIELVAQELSEGGVASAGRWPVDVGAEEPFETDLRLGQSPFGIEWVSAQDRHDHGERIPRPDPSGQLRIMPGVGEDAQAQILVLDHESYRYDPDLERVQRGSTGAAEAQGRLRRDVRDYLEYVRGQGAL